jgi:4-amino-4-deoxy-L-arabinose transferase-like glycosyltransferase
MKRAWLPAGVAAIYFTATCILAARKPLWFDELFTYHISQVPTLTDLWRTLAQGFDPNPPLVYALTRWAQSILGGGPVALRLPAILGFAVMCACLYCFVARRCPRSYAWLALVLPLTTGAYGYAYEARAYGTVLGFSGIALVCWQAAAEGSHRGLALTGLALSLAGAVSSHYYAVLLFIPLALGEGVRAWRRRTFDWPIWTALLLGAAPLALLYPLVKAARENAAKFWGQASWGGIATTYEFLLAPAAAPLVAALVLLAFWRGKSSGEHKADPWPIPLHERIAAVGLACLPVFGVLLGKLATGVYVERYGLPAVAGLSLLGAFVACRRAEGRPLLGGVLAVLFFGWYLAAWQSEAGKMNGRLAAIDDECRRLKEFGHRDRPMAVSHPHVFLQLWHYAPPEVATRLRYLASRSASVQFLGNDTNDRALQGLAELAQAPVVDYEAFVGEEPCFLVYGGERWLTRALEADGATLEVIGETEGRFLFVASTTRIPAPPAATKAVQR